MACSICSETTSEYYKISCGHNICSECIHNFQKQRQNVIDYQCMICFQKTNLTQLKKYNHIEQNTQHFTEDTQLNTNQILFCWNCQKVVTVNKYFLQQHKNHKINLYSQIKSFLKQKYMKQYHKGLILLNLLKNNNNIIQNINIQSKYQKIQKQITDCFNQQIQILINRKQQILKQLNVLYQNSKNIIQLQSYQTKSFIGNLEKICANYQEFINGKKLIPNCQDINQYLSICNRKIDIPPFPIFIQHFNMKDYAKACCELKQFYAKTTQKAQQKQNYQFHSKSKTAQRLKFLYKIDNN